MHISELHVTRIFGVTRQRIRYWRKIGLLPPYVSGKKQGYSFQDVLKIKIVSALVSQGIRPARIRDTLASLRLLLDKDDVLLGKSFYICGKEIFIFQGGKAITPRTGQYLLFEVDTYQKQVKNDVLKIDKTMNRHLGDIEVIENNNAENDPHELLDKRVGAQ